VLAGSSGEFRERHAQLFQEWELTNFSSDWKSRSDALSADKTESQEGFKTVVS
jgi:hypothetical protein